jgi:hypothetical protein
MRSLVRALQERGHDVTASPNDALPPGTPDDEQLDYTAKTGRILITFNVRDFAALHQDRPDHPGILLAIQRQWSLSALIAALDHLAREGDPERLQGTLGWLNEWRR